MNRRRLSPCFLKYRTSYGIFAKVPVYSRFRQILAVTLVLTLLHHLTTERLDAQKVVRFHNHVLRLMIVAAWLPVPPSALAYWRCRKIGDNAVCFNPTSIPPFDKGSP